MHGVGGLLEVYEDKLAISPKGVLGLMNKGLKGTKTIPFFSISGIQFKKSGGLTNGYLQFTIAGGNESTGGLFAAVSDENSFMFAGQNDLALRVKDYIEKRMHELRMPQPVQVQVTNNSTSVADELMKLADLKAKGILSDDEFQAAKRKLIG